ncbi:hypothetical protein AURDEDRAFT_114701 [Auricularia subglabra TFB-10046 SS5]|nr:hypothetical protein AURDEDRAFT_114701 [Auricularia subglabra TFB-10046 SS5]
MPKDTGAKPKRKAAAAPRAAKGKKAGAPKRALSAYMFFVQDWRDRIKEENPDASFGEVGKLLGAKWKEMDDEDKEPYNQKATKDKARAAKEKAGKAGKEASADDDEE